MPQLSELPLSVAVTHWHRANGAVLSTIVIPETQEEVFPEASETDKDKVWGLPASRYAVLSLHTAVGEIVSRTATDERQKLMLPEPSITDTKFVVVPKVEQLKEEG